MKMDGIPYDFSMELQHVGFRDSVKKAPTSHMAPMSLVAGDATRLHFDPGAEMVCVLSWDNKQARDAKRAPAVALVPLSNIASMVPMAPPPAQAKKAG